jgi:hypothetical protein
MDAPALCRFVGLMGHMTDLACPKCKISTRPGLTVGAGDKRSASGAKVDKKQIFATPHLTLAQLASLLRTDESWRKGKSPKIPFSMLHFSLFKRYVHCRY